MLKEIAQEARNLLATQDRLWKGDVDDNQEPGLCTGLAITTAATKLNGGTYDIDAVNKVRRGFVVVNGIIVEGDDNWKSCPTHIYKWNDRPERTLAEAVAALDKLVDYLGSQEQG